MGQNPILPAGTHSFPASLPDVNLLSMPHGLVLRYGEQNIDNLFARGLCVHVFLWNDFCSSGSQVGSGLGFPLWVGGGIEEDMGVPQLGLIVSLVNNENMPR